MALDTDLYAVITHPERVDPHSVAEMAYSLQAYRGIVDLIQRHRLRLSQAARDELDALIRTLPLDERP